MHPKKFALIGGLIMLAIGVLAFIPALSDYPANLPALRLDTAYGLFLGYLPMNVLNKIALIAFGLAGIFASSDQATNLPKSIAYSRWVFYAMGALAILGLIPQTNTLFGYWPLYGYTILEHALFAVVGAYFGYALTAQVHEKDMPRPANREHLAQR